MKISAVILTKNEEANIERAIKSVKFCDETIIIDDYSTDNTVMIGEKSGARIYKRKLNGDFAGQRNFGMSKASNEWVLFIDADEEISDELKKEIKDSIERHSGERSDSRIVVPNNDSGQAGMTSIEVYYLKRRDFFWSRELRFGETAKIRSTGIIRLVRRGSGSWKGKVHEEFQVKSQKSLSAQAGKVKSLKNYLNHYPHQTVKEFLEEVNFYSTLRAKELQSQGKKASIFEIAVYPLGKFLLTYFIKLGFLDGPAGFVYAFFMSFHSFLVRAKLYQYVKLHPQGVNLTNSHPEGV